MKTASGAILGSAFFGPGRFLLDFWVQLGCQTGLLGRLSADFRDFLANCGVTCDFSLLEGARGGSGDRFRMSGGASRQGFWEDFGWFYALLWSFVAFYFCSNFVPSLAQFQISCCSTVSVSPLLPCPSVAGAAVARSVLNYCRISTALL